MRFLPSQQRWQRHRRERTGRWRTNLYKRDQLNKEALLVVQQIGVMPREAGVHLPAPTAGWRYGSLLVIRRWTLYGHSFRVSTESKYMPAAC